MCSTRRTCLPGTFLHPPSCGTGHVFGHAEGASSHARARPPTGQATFLPPSQPEWSHAAGRRPRGCGSTGDAHGLFPFEGVQNQGAHLSATGVWLSRAMGKKPRHANLRQNKGKLTAFFDPTSASLEEEGDGEDPQGGHPKRPRTGAAAAATRVHPVPAVSAYEQQQRTAELETQIEALQGQVATLEAAAAAVEAAANGAAATAERRASAGHAGGSGAGQDPERKVPPPPRMHAPQCTPLNAPSSSRDPVVS